MADDFPDVLNGIFYMRELRCVFDRSSGSVIRWTGRTGKSQALHDTTCALPGEQLNAAQKKSKMKGFEDPKACWSKTMSCYSTTWVLIEREKDTLRSAYSVQFALKSHLLGHFRKQSSIRIFKWPFQSCPCFVPSSSNLTTVKLRPWRLVIKHRSWFLRTIYLACSSHLISNDC